MRGTPSSIRCCTLLAAALAALPRALAGQTVRGVVVDGGDRPVPGVVVLLVDSASAVLARSLTDERGSYRVVAPHGGSFRLRTLRIGYRPVISARIELATGVEVTRRLVLTGLPIALDTIRVVDRNVCRAFTDSGAATFAVWEQVRTALTAAQLTAASRAIAATTVAYDRTTGARPGIDEGKLQRQDVAVRTGYVTQPWKAVGADTLRRFGYMMTLVDNSMVYYAPDIDVLLSDMFVEDHCFRLVRDRRRASQIGIAFEPVPDRRRVPEIRGTIWVDRSSSELRSLEFRYTNVEFEQQEYAGGNVEFVRMRDGTWAISRWDIHMPMLEQLALPGRPPEMRVARIQTTGGELSFTRRDSDTLWMGQRFALAGTVVDSLTGDGVPDARVRLSGTGLEASTDEHGRFVIPGVLRGLYNVEVHTPALDSLRIARRWPVSFADSAFRLQLLVPATTQIAATICGAARARDSVSGIVLGRALLRDSTVPSNLTIRAEWDAGGGVGPDTSARTRVVEVHGATDGTYRLCGVPINTALRVHATGDSAETADVATVRLAGSARLARVDLMLDRVSALAARGAVFTGIVVTDSTHIPIVGAEVALPDARKSTVTDARGEFRITGIAQGEQHVVVRRLGYGAADTKVTFHGSETVERRVVLGRAIMLEPVTVSERAVERQMQSFEDNKRVGLGHFMTRDQIAPYDGMMMSAVLQQIPGMALLHGRTSGAWVTSKRVNPPICPGNGKIRNDCLESHGFYIEGEGGAPIACYSLVYLDGVLMNGSREPTEPFDMSSIAPERVEAVEYYAGASQTPLQYSKMGSNCGVLVIWTRRLR